MVSKNTVTIDVGAAPQHFALDSNGMLWVSLGSYYGLHSQDNIGLQAINTANNTLSTFLNFPSIGDEGHMAIDGNGKNLYFLTAEAWPGTSTNVFVLDTDTKTISVPALITGSNFAAIGFNKTTEKLYISDAAGFQGPGRILVYDKTGAKVDEKTTGIGPSHFIFK